MGLELDKRKLDENWIRSNRDREGRIRTGVEKMGLELDWEVGIKTEFEIMWLKLDYKRIVLEKLCLWKYGGIIWVL